MSGYDSWKTRSPDDEMFHGLPYCDEPPEEEEPEEDSMTHSYDSRCYDLAEVFLRVEPSLNNEKHKRDLAQEIQDVIEDYIAYERERTA